jgi:hypothetical protein
MQKLAGVMGVGLLLISLCCSGCEELQMKSDHVTVNVMAAISVKVVDADNRELNVNVDGMSVFIEMTKQGRDRLVFDRIIQAGLCQATGTFEMTKGQWINCTATVQGSYMGYYAVAPVTAMLSWDTVNASVNFGAMYHWYPELTITMKKA